MTEADITGPGCQGSHPVVASRRSTSQALTKTFDLKSSKFRGSASRDGPLRQIQVEFFGGEKFWIPQKTGKNWFWDGCVLVKGEVTVKGTSWMMFLWIEW